MNVLFGKPVIIKSQLFHFYLFFPMYCRKTLKSMFSTFVDFVVFFSEWTVRRFFFLIIEISNIHVFEFYYKNMFIIWFLNTDFELCYDFYVFVWKTHLKKKNEDWLRNKLNFLDDKWRLWWKDIFIFFKIKFEVTVRKKTPWCDYYCWYMYMYKNSASFY